MSRRTLHAIVFCSVVGAILLALVWLEVETRRYSHSLADLEILVRLLKAYMHEHAGAMPGSVAELLASRHAVAASDGSWSVTLPKWQHPVTTRAFQWVDVAWGTKANEIERNGKLISGSRFLFVPASGRYEELRGRCEAYSSMMGEFVHQNPATNEKQ